MRLYDKKVDINQDKIKSFFDKRGKRADKNSILSSTMFTEKEKAEKRDFIENLNKKFEILLLFICFKELIFLKHFY